MSRPCKICSWEGLEDFNAYMVRHNPVFREGVKYCASKGLKITEPTVTNHCYKHIVGYKKNDLSILDNVENYGGLADSKTMTIPHSFDPQSLRNDLGVVTSTNDPQTVTEVIVRGLNKSIELSTLALYNALTAHSQGERQYPLDMVRGLKDLVAIASTLTAGKGGTARYDSVLDVDGLIKKPVQKELDMSNVNLATITVWE